MCASVKVAVSVADRIQLDAIVVDRNSPREHIWRAQIVLSAMDGCGIMRRAGVSRTGLGHWQKCLVIDPVPGLPRNKTPPPRIPLPEPEVAVRMVCAMPADPSDEATRWTAVTTARVQGVGVNSVQHYWRKHGPHLHGTRQFKLSNDPKFASKLREIVGYMSIRRRMTRCSRSIRAEQ
jgi:hypothetical protein